MTDIELGIVGEKQDVMSFLTDLFESEVLELGMSKEIRGAGIITLERLPLTKGFPAVGEYVATIAITVGKAIDAVRLVVGYLCQKRKTHNERELKVVINRREWQFHQSDLTKVIEECIEVEEKKSRRVRVFEPAESLTKTQSWEGGEGEQHETWDDSISGRQRKAP